MRISSKARKAQALQEESWTMFDKRKEMLEISMVQSL